MGKGSQTNDAKARGTAQGPIDSPNVVDTVDASPSTSNDVIIPISRRAIALFCFVILAPWLIVIAALILPKYTTTEPLAAIPSSTSIADEPASDVTSAWGRLTETRITISPPIEFMEELDMSKVGSDWHFSDSISMSLDERLAEFGIAKGVRDQIAKLNESSLEGVVHITNEVLSEIPLETRAKLYDYLSRDPRNFDQFNAFRYCGGSVDEWFNKSRLRPELLERIKPMIYTRGSVLFFSDLRLMIPELESEKERIQLLKVLSRESTRLVRLHVDNGSDINELIDYWGRFGRAKDVRPILESLALAPDGGDIDLVHLLPPFARERIYTYPGTANGNLVVQRNSHWTALNFFAEQVDDRFTVLDQVGEALQNDYFPIVGEPRFGDLVCFTDKNGDLYHTAVYIAQDLLYTKNGHRVSRPWMLLSKEEMTSFYPRQGTPVIRYFRRKDS